MPCCLKPQKACLSRAEAQGLLGDDSLGPWRGKSTIDTIDAHRARSTPIASKNFLRRFAPPRQNRSTFHTIESERTRARSADSLERRRVVDRRKSSAPLIRATTCARLWRERARPLRRGLECTVLTASTVAARAPRRTSRPTHAPEPRDSPPDGPLVHLLHICFTKAVRPSLAATRPLGWRSDAARGALTRAASTRPRVLPRAQKNRDFGTT